LPQENIEILLASKSNKRKSDKQRDIIIVCIVALVTLVLLFLLPNFAATTSDINQAAKVDDFSSVDVSQGNSASKSSFSAVQLYFETELKPALEAIPAETAFARRAQRLLKQLVGLFQQFALTGAYSPGIDGEIKAAENLLQEYNQVVTDSLTRVESAFQNRDAKQFIVDLNGLQIIAGENAEVASWVAKKADVLQYFDLFQLANRLRSESNLEAEFDALSRIDAMGYSDSIISDRMSFLKDAIAEKQFASHIQATLDFISSNDFVAAKKEITKAYKLFPSRSQVVELTQRVDLALKKIRANQLVQLGLKKAALDDWVVAKEHFSSALEILPEQQLAKDEFERANSILRYKDKLSSIARSPLRLKSQEVLDYANQLMTDSKQFSEFSESLVNLQVEVEALIRQKMLPRSVWMDSDGKAKIRVKGVGYIMPTKGRYVDLVPGNYIFFAECKGRKTKIYNVQIPIEGDVPAIKVLCGVKL
jgi:hypothetical protein